MYLNCFPNTMLINQRPSTLASMRSAVPPILDAVYQMGNAAADELVITPGTSFCVTDEPRSLEHRQVLGDGCDIGSYRLGQFPDATSLFLEHFHDDEPRWMCQRFQ